MDYLEKLNTEQKKAVLHTEGPLLILAGAGAGKTRVITYRILHLISTGIAPESILAVTFTNKAAKEMKEKINTLLSEQKQLNFPVSQHARPFVSTFHALGVHIIREHGRLLNIRARFTILDRGDSVRIVKDAIKEAGLDPKEYEPRKILSAISKQKGNAVTAHMYEKRVGSDYYPRLVATVWKIYEKILRNEKALDFDDLLLKALELLTRHESVRREYQRQWKYIHIDEYQDTNTVQYKLARLLTGDNKNICVVGDPDQNIYSWRNANLENILNFEKQYRNTTVVLLEQNYRSTKTILNAAHEVIRINKNRVEKKLFTENAAGEKISVFSALDETGEAYAVTEKVKNLLKKGVEPREIAVLYRANFQSRVLEEAFLGEQLPYQVLGVRFFERKEVKDILAFVRAALSGLAEESPILTGLTDLKRIINVPPRGIGKTTLLRMIVGNEHELSPALKNKVNYFRELLIRIRECARTNTPSKTIAFILRETSLEEKLKTGGEDDAERLENIKELVTLATRYDTLPREAGIEKLLEDAALASDQDELKEDKNAVRLMTVHASKGLEFDYVFIVGLEEGLFPHKSLSSENIDEEEERRLFYVALTRARKKVYLLYASVRTIFGSEEQTISSEFITDISDELLETEDASSSEHLPSLYFD